MLQRKTEYRNSLKMETQHFGIESYNGKNKNMIENSKKYFRVLGIIVSIIIILVFLDFIFGNFISGWNNPK